MKKERSDVIRTRKLIVDTYMSLCLKMPSSKITVSRLISEAGISRATFYVYFLDILDLKDKVITEFREKRLNLLDTESHETLIQNPSHLLLRGFQMFRDNADMILALTDQGKDGSFFYEYKDLMQKKLADASSGSKNANANSYVNFFISSIYVDTCRKIIMEKNSDLDLEYVAEIASWFIVNAIHPEVPV